jgi:hypothetical protein
MGQWIRITGALYPLWIKNGMNMNMEQLSLHMMIMHLPESAKWWRFENAMNIQMKHLLCFDQVLLDCRGRCQPNKYFLLIIRTEYLLVSEHIQSESESKNT